MTGPRVAPETFILIANASGARLCVQRGRGGVCRTVRSFAHPAGAASGRELVSDRPGRFQQGSRRSAAEPPTSPRHVEAARFARELTAQLGAAVREDATARVLLVAPPRFLGLLREELDDGLRARIAGSVAADLTAVPEPELPQRLEALRDQL